MYAIAFDMTVDDLKQHWLIVFKTGHSQIQKRPFIPGRMEKGQYRASEGNILRTENAKETPPRVFNDPFVTVLSGSGALYSERTRSRIASAVVRSPARCMSDLFSLILMGSGHCGAPTCIAFPRHGLERFGRHRSSAQSSSMAIEVARL